MKEPSRRRFLQRTAATSIGVAAAGRGASGDQAQPIALAGSTYFGARKVLLWESTRKELREAGRAEGTQLTYRFDGRIQGPSTPGQRASLGTGQTMEGEVELGEYGKARWTARRPKPRQA